MELQKINRSLAFELVNETKSAEWLAEDDYIYDVPLGLVLLLSFFYGTISLLAVIGNSLVIWIVVTTRTMQTVTNWYIANLAMADVIIGAFAIPFQVRDWGGIGKERAKWEVTSLWDTLGDEMNEWTT